MGASNANPQPEAGPRVRLLPQLSPAHTRFQGMVGGRKRCPRQQSSRAPRAPPACPGVGTGACYAPRRCEVDCELCVPGDLQRGSVGRVVRVILCAACGTEWVGRSGWPTRALSRGLPEEGRSVDRSDPKLASERCARRVGRSQVVSINTTGWGMHICVVSVRLASQGNRVKVHAKTLVRSKSTQKP